MKAATHYFPLLPVRVDESLGHRRPARVRILAPRAGAGPLLLLCGERTGQIAQMNSGRVLGGNLGACTIFDFEFAFP